MNQPPRGSATEDDFETVRSWLPDVEANRPDDPFDALDRIAGTIEQQQARMKRVESHVESCNATHCRMLHESLNQNPPNPRSAEA